MRRAFAAVAFLGAVAVLAGPGPACANDGAAIYAKIKAALAAQTSYLEIATTGLGDMESVTTRTVVQSPHGTFAVKLSLRNGPTSVIETYFLDRAVFVFVDGHWFKTALDSATGAEMNRELGTVDPLPDPGLPIEILPDRASDGHTYGVIRFTAATHDDWAVNGKPVKTPAPSVECRYEKTTFLLHECIVDAGLPAQQHIRFDKFGDPGNAIVLPPEAATGAPMNAQPTRPLNEH